MRGLVITVSSILLMPLFAHAAERSLPRGEDNPRVITKIFASPVGEVQFLEENDGGSSAMLRDAKGYLSALQEIRGPSSCDEWIISNKEGSLPAGCSFIFYKELSGTYERVNSEEMQEASLFQVVRGTLRGKNVAL